jgi:hypothetical protein
MHGADLLILLLLLLLLQCAGSLGRPCSRQREHNFCSSVQLDHTPAASAGAPAGGGAGVHVRSKVSVAGCGDWAFLHAVWCRCVW